MPPRNRIPDDCTEEPKTVTKATVKAYRVWMWRCPGCTRANLAEKSTTHVARCGVCNAVATIVVKD